MVLAKNLTQEEAKDIAKWKKVEDSGVKITLKRFIENREVVVKRELMDLWKVDRKTIERYVAKGMPVHSSSFKGLQVFDILLCENWRETNINKSQSLKNKSKKKTEVEVDIEDGFNESGYELEDISTEEAERRLKIKENIIKEYKIKELSQELIPSDTTDKATAEFNASMVSWLMNHREILSRDLENKTKSEIYSILDETFGSYVEDCHKTVGREYNEDELTKYHILEKIEEFMESEPEQIEKFMRAFNV